MRRFRIPGALCAALALTAGGALAASSNLSGTWVATFATHPITLHLAGAGSSYRGTYAFTAATIVKGKVRNQVEIVPVKATEATKNHVVHVTITLTKTHSIIACTLAKNTLTCRPLVGTTPIIFTHVRP